ncbi:hypothetical protein BURKHO8Y_10165 [Burkholderia sp. 8Y]|nr:hypothetical protein BURKHO8Y_10165 [Burkholderia sp. 8Y]
MDTFRQSGRNQTFSACGTHSRSSVGIAWPITISFCASFGLGYWYGVMASADGLGAGIASPMSIMWIVQSNYGQMVAPL